MKKVIIITIVAAVMAATATTAQASPMHWWPTWFTRTQVAGCVKQGGTADPITCGCLVRQLRMAWTFSQAYSIEVKLEDGDYVPPSVKRTITWAALRCAS